MTTDLATKLASVSDGIDNIQEEFGATGVELVPTDSGSIQCRLTFRGFSELQEAIDKTTAVALELIERPGVIEINRGVDSDGGDGPYTDETGDRPVGWVNVTLEQGADGGEDDE